MAEQLSLCLGKTVAIKGYLQKRQRGKNIRRETQRKTLKFQERFCELNEDLFIYRKKENGMILGSFHVEHVKIVNNTDPKTFPEGTLKNPELCFQIGNENEILYLVAPNQDLKKKWMDAFVNAQDKGNVMLQFYHCGAYGSKTTEKWSCCNESVYQAPGCTDATLGFCRGVKKWSEPVEFGDSIDSFLTRPRTDTGESGIDENQFDGVYSEKRKKLHSTGDSFDNDLVSERYSSEESIIHADEGIEHDIKRAKRKTNEAVFDEELTVQQESYHRDTSEKCKHQGMPSNLYLIDSHKLPRPPTELMLHQNSLMSGNGMVHYGA